MRQPETRLEDEELAKTEHEKAEAPGVEQSSDEDEELEEVPDKEQALDPLFRTCIRRRIGGQWYRGVVVGMETELRTMERLYRIKYEDGDLEHMTKAEVNEFAYSHVRRR